MRPDKIKANLTAEEYDRWFHARLLIRDSNLPNGLSDEEIFEWGVKNNADVSIIWAHRVKRFLEALAERNRLLREAEKYAGILRRYWTGDYYSDGEPRNVSGEKLDKFIIAIAAVLKGVGE